MKKQNDSQNHPVGIDVSLVFGIGSWALSHYHHFLGYTVTCFHEIHARNRCIESDSACREAFAK